MPDDDRHTRDRVRTLDPVARELSRRARECRGSGFPPEQLALPLDEVRPRARETLDRVLRKLGKPDLATAAEHVRDLAGQIQDGQEPDLCAGYRRSGMQALLDQAVSVVLATEDPAVLADPRGGKDIAARIGEEFARGALRRYALDRVSPFEEGGQPASDVADTAEAVELLELTDLTFTSTLLRELAGELLR